MFKKDNFVPNLIQSRENICNRDIKITIHHNTKYHCTKYIIKIQYEQEILKLYFLFNFYKYTEQSVANGDMIRK